MQLSATPGIFKTYRSMSRIHLGQYGIDLHEGSLFMYDGVEIVLDDQKYRLPQLRSQYRFWFTDAEDTEGVYQSSTSPLLVRPAQHAEENAGLPMARASEEEAVVGTLEDSSRVREAASRNDQAAVEGLRHAKRVQAAARAGLVEAPQRLDPSKYRSEKAMVEDANQINARVIEEALRKLNAVDPKKTKEEMGGHRHNTLLDGKVAKSGGKYQIESDVMDSDGVREYTFSKGAQVGPLDAALQAAQQKPVNVATARVSESIMQAPRRVDPANLGNPMASQVGPEDYSYLAADESITVMPALPAKRVASVRNEEEVLPPRHKLPKKPVALTETEEIAEIVEGWSLKRNWQKRVDEAVTFYADWPEVLEALYRIESPAVVKQIQSKLPTKK